MSAAPAAPATQPGEVTKSGTCERKVDAYDDHEYVVTHSWRKHPRGLRLESRLVRDGRKGRTVYAHTVNTVQALSAAGKVAAEELMAVRREKHLKHHPEARRPRRGVEIEPCPMTAAVREGDDVAARTRGARATAAPSTAPADQEVSKDAARYAVCKKFCEFLCTHSSMCHRLLPCLYVSISGVRICLFLTAGVCFHFPCGLCCYCVRRSYTIFAYNLLIIAKIVFKVDYVTAE